MTRDPMVEVADRYRMFGWRPTQASSWPLVWVAIDLIVQALLVTLVAGGVLTWRGAADAWTTAALCGLAVLLVSGLRAGYQVRRARSGR